MLSKIFELSAAKRYLNFTYIFGFVCFSWKCEALILNYLINILESKSTGVFLKMAPVATVEAEIAPTEPPNDADKESSNHSKPTVGIIYPPPELRSILLCNFIIK